MSNAPDRNSGLALPGVLLLGFAAAGYYTATANLDVVRPASHNSRSIVWGAVEPIPARLWEDPFRAYRRALERTTNEPLTIPVPCTGPLPPNYEDFAEGDTARPATRDSLHLDGPAEVLLVVSHAGSYAEDAENRKRSRYAVLSALGDTGYRAVDGEHIGAFTLQFEQSVDDTRVGPGQSSHFVLPFERYECIRWQDEVAGHQPTGAGMESRSDTVLVVWVPNYMLGDEPLGVLHGTIRGLAEKVTADESLSFSIIGPTSSQSLVSMIRETESCMDPACPATDVPVISNWATISDHEIDLHKARAEAQSGPRIEPAPGPGAAGPGAGTGGAARGTGGRIAAEDPGRDDEQPGGGGTDPEGVHTFRKSRDLAYGLRLFRQTEDDETLILELLEELELRGIEPGTSTIGLITEWNTDYGQSFYETLRRHVKAEDSLIRFVYMQGIDGRVPHPNNVVDDDAAALPGEDQENPLGRRQTDYLRRLVGEMVGEDFAAIGVVGSDVYDKLLILRALRSHFPHTLFFTTDLDVRFLDADERPWTQNLLVSSHYSLDPNQELVREGLSDTHAMDALVLPMRGAYQVATFLACKRALLHEDTSASEVVPSRGGRLYEIARTGAFDLERQENEGPTGWILAALPALLLLALFSGREVFDPRVAELLGRTGLIALCLLFSSAAGYAIYRLAEVEGVGALPKLLAIPMVAVIAVYRFWSYFRQRLVEDGEEGKQAVTVDKAVPRNVAYATLAYLVVGSIIYAGSFLGPGEPLVLFEGISIWPSVAVRLVVILCSATFLFALIRKVDDWDKDMETRFGLEAFEPGELAVPPVPRTPGLRWVINKVNAVRRYFGLHKTDVEARLGNELASFLRNPLRYLFLHEREVAGSWVTERGVRDLGEGWGWYRTKSERRIGRSIRAVVLFSVLVLAAYFLEGSHGSLVRGQIARVSNVLTWWLAILGVSLLLFFALDATRTCWRLLLPMADVNRTIVWPEASRRLLVSPPGKQSEDESLASHGSKDDLDGLLDVRFAADLTHGIASVVWYPFGLLLLLVLGQNPFFESWKWSPSSIGLFVVLALLVLVADLRLRAAAERLRNRAVQRLQQQKLFHLVASERTEFEEIDLALEEVRETKRGAFRPFVQHPVVAAVLLPFGGVGSLALLEQFMG